MTPQDKNGQRDLQQLLANMQPELQKEEFIFCTLSPKSSARLAILPIGYFHEPEGITIILEKKEADRCKLTYLL